MINAIKKLIPAQTRDRYRVAFYMPRRLFLSALYKCNLLKYVARDIPGIHLGSGMSRISKFINIDGGLKSSCDVVGRIEKLKFADNSVGIIYCSHALEHISHRDTTTVLAEWYRVLKPGGQLYIAVPDVEVLFRMYLDNLGNYDDPKTKAMVDDFLKIVFGSQSYPLNFHKSGYSFATLKAALQDVGFADIAIWGENSSTGFEMPEDASSTRRNGVLISLNVKAKKLA